MGGDKSEIERAWQYLRTQQTKSIPMMYSYGKKYKQYLINECTLDDIQQYKKQLKLFSSELIAVVQLLAEIDIINQLKYSKQDYCHLTPKLKHIYTEQFWYIHSYRPSRNNLTSFIYYLNELIQSKSAHNQNRKASLVLGFQLALDMFNKYFSDKKILH